MHVVFSIVGVVHFVVFLWVRQKCLNQYAEDSVSEHVKSH